MSKGVCPYCGHNKWNRPYWCSANQKVCKKCDAVSTHLEWKEALRGKKEEQLKLWKHLKNSKY